MSKDNQSQTSSLQPAPSVSAKRPYHTPTLREHGNISQHTLAARVGTSTDGTIVPVYAS